MTVDDRHYFIMDTGPPEAVQSGVASSARVMTDGWRTVPLGPRQGVLERPARLLWRCIVRNVALLCLVFFACVLGPSQLGAQSSADPESDGPPDAEAVMKLVFPQDPHPEEAAPPLPRLWYLTAFVSRSDQDVGIYLELRMDGTARLEVGKTACGSLDEQLGDLFDANEDISVKDAAARVKIVRRSADLASLPKLKLWIAEIEHTRMPVLVNEPFNLHGGTRYRVWSLGRFSAPDASNYFSIGFDGPAPEGKPPNRLAAVLEEICASFPDPPCSKGKHQ